MTRITKNGDARPRRPVPRWPILLVLAWLVASFTTWAGCGARPSAKVMCGAVTCGGETVPAGRITFVPVNTSPGRVCAAPIIDGQYRIKADGGVPLGTYRVQVDARRKTGRKVEKFNGVEMALTDEEISIGPKGYGDQRSPLVVEVDKTSSGIYDIAIPLNREPQSHSAQ